MNAEVIYTKTEKGKGEVANRSDELSMEARRVLILVNGESPAEDIKRKALIEDIDSELENLETAGYIQLVAGEEAANEPVNETVEEEDTIRDPELTVPIAAAQDFMANTLLTFGNRVRVKDLIEQIQNSQDAGALRDLIKPWYQAISDTPNGMYQADHLKEDLVKMLG